MTSEELSSALLGSPLAGRHDLLLQLTKPCVRISTERASPDSFRIGESRVGGVPDLPPGFSWPTWKGEPQSFIAQIRLEDTPPIPRLGLPAEGSLCFFYSARQDTWGFDPGDAGSFAVVYFDPTTELQRLAEPPSIPDGGEFLQCSVTFRESLSLPPWESRPIERLQLDDPEQDAYFDLLDIDTNPEEHQLGGYPDQIQGDMTRELPLVTHGLFTGDASGWNDPRAEGLKAEWKEWTMLFQAGSDLQPQMMWGDMGYLYYWLKQDALEAGAFDQAWLILQCS